MEENKEMLELLRKIEKSSRAQARTGTLVCIFALIAAVSCVVAGGKITAPLVRFRKLFPSLRRKHN